jgi:transcriptional regulator with XRE-family HTH domain
MERDMVSEEHDRQFGETVRNIREARGYGLRELAGVAGMTPAYLSMIENGKVPPPSEQKVMAIAHYLEVDAAEFLTLAGRLPEDLVEILRERPLHMTALLRLAYLLSDDELYELIETIVQRSALRGAHGREWARAQRSAMESHEALRRTRYESHYPRRRDDLPPWRR